MTLPSAQATPPESEPLVCFTLPPVDFGQPNETARRISDALDSHLLVRMAGPLPDPEVRDLWNKVVMALGDPCFDGEDGVTGEKNKSMWVDVRYDAERQHTFRHSSTAQPLHTDSAYNPVQTDVTVFICEHNAISGGETIFISAAALADLAQEHDKKLYDELFALPIPYGKAGIRGRTTPVLGYHEGELHVNWNYYRVLKDESAQVADFAERLFAFLQDEIVAAGHVLPVKLEPGEALFFRDTRVLHGRQAFMSGPRCLWKCAFTRHGT